MDVHEAKTFRSGRAVAVKLPDGFAPGERLRIEAEGDRLTLRRLPDRTEIARRLREKLAVLEAIGRPRSSAAP